MKRTSHCFISWSHISEGSVVYHREYARALARLGREVTLLGRGEGEQKWLESNLKAIPLKDVGNSDSISHIAFLAAAIAHLRRNSYDFVDASLSPGIGILPLFVGRQKITWVLHIRSSYVKEGLMGLCRNALGRLDFSLFDAATIIDKHIAPRLFISEVQLERMLELPLGVNPDNFVRGQDERFELFGEIARNKTALIYVGKTDRTRRLDLMLEAFRLVLEKCPAVMLVIVGGGDRRGYLIEVARKLGVESKVIFTGPVSYLDVSRYLSAADVALTYIPINPTYEWQPALKALEYLQMAVPQVATATRANAKYIRDGINGILADDAPRQFADGILRLINDNPLYERIRRDCGQDMEKYHWDELAKERLIPFYDRIASK